MLPPSVQCQESVVVKCVKTGTIPRDIFLDLLFLGSSRMAEWSRCVEEIFAAAIITSVFPRSQLEIFIEVLNADGSKTLHSITFIVLGVLAAAVNATTLALIDAGVPLYDYVIGTSIGYLAKQSLLDLNRLEEGAGGNNPNLTLASYGRRPEQVLLMNADGRIASDKLASMCELAQTGIRKIFELLDTTVVRPHLEEQLRIREGQ